jgi:hypothetical protein
MTDPQYKFENLKDLAEHFFDCGHEDSQNSYYGYPKKTFEQYWEEVFKNFINDDQCINCMGDAGG